jgi:hypothetical protein
VSEIGAKLHSIRGRIVAEMWRVTALLYFAIHAAVLPVQLHDVPQFLDIFLGHIARRNEKKRPKQTEIFLGQLDPPDAQPAHPGPPARALSEAA